MLFQESLELARELNDLPGIAAALRYLGLVAIAQGDTTGAIELYQEALPLTRQLGDEEALANLLNNLGIAETYRHNLERGEELTAESLAIRRRLDDPHGMALSLHTLSYYARMRQEWPRAKELLGEALGLYASLGTRENALECLESLAVVECEQGQHEHAAQLYGASGHLRELLHLPTHPNNQQAIENEIAGVRDRLKPDEFSHLWTRGQQMSLEEAIAFAQGKGQPVILGGSEE
jgi:tetratricopeptide (TPR) repeat protein